MSTPDSGGLREAAHPVLQHRDGQKCIWVDGEWFVPLDVGGEGYSCEHPEHHEFLAARPEPVPTPDSGGHIPRDDRLITCPECRSAFENEDGSVVSVPTPDSERHVVHVTAKPVAEDVVWCDECEEWVESSAPDSATVGERECNGRCDSRQSTDPDDPDFPDPDCPRHGATPPADDGSGA